MADSLVLRDFYASSFESAEESGREAAASVSKTRADVGDLPKVNSREAAAITNAQIAATLENKWALVRIWGSLSDTDRRAFLARLNPDGSFREKIR